METTILRVASPNEKRCIVRHSLGFYSNIIVSGIYRIPRSLTSESRLQTARFYVPILADCIRQHPVLAATTADANTNEPTYTRPKRLDVQSHVRIVRKEEIKSLGSLSEENETELLQRFVELVHNDFKLKFISVDSRPPWALDSLLLSEHDTEHYRILVAFTYSHSHGDGISGLVFHQSFYDALQKYLGTDQISQMHESEIECPSLPFPDQPDTSTSMPISLSYLLRPALGTYLPRFLSRLFGLTGNVSGADDQTWTGSQMFTDSKSQGLNVTTTVEIIHIDAQVLANTLALCKAKGGKLTSLMNQIIAGALSEAIERTNEGKNLYTNLIATTPVNLRKTLKASPDTIGVYGGAVYLRYTFNSSGFPSDEDSWQLVRTQSQQLAHGASTAQDQAIGLLRFVSNFESWMRGQIGQPRDCSWELSNLGNFDPSSAGVTDRKHANVRVEQMFFSQPASPIGPPMTFNMVAVKDGGLNVCVSWQPGALGISTGTAVGDGSNDRAFVRQIITSIERQFTQLAQAS